MPSPPPSSPPPVAPQSAALSRQARRLATLPEPPWLNGEVARRLADKLDAIRLEPRDWIDWGAFLGAGQAPVARRYPEARRWVCEPTSALQARSEQAWAAAQRKGWWGAWKRQPAPVAGPGDDKPAGWPSEGAGLLWANMALHTLSDLPAALQSWRRALAVDGFLMCSGLGPDTCRELRSLYRAMGWGEPTVQFIDMHDLGDELVKAGFADPVMDMERLTLTWADAEALLAELRTWGGNVAWGRFNGCRTPRWRQRLLAALTQALAGPDGRLSLTVEVVYGHAVKPLPRAAVAEETRVTLDDMRRMIKGAGGGGGRG